MVKALGEGVIEAYNANFSFAAESNTLVFPAELFVAYDFGEVRRVVVIASPGVVEAVYGLSACEVDACGDAFEDPAERAKFFYFAVVHAKEMFAGPGVVEAVKRCRA